jgi:hypothetical protein
MIIVEKLNIYPIKSFAGIAQDFFELSERGLSLSLACGMKIYDREWMVVSNEGRFLTQRELPEMARIEIVMAENGLWLRHPNAKDDFFLSAEQEQQKIDDVIKTIVWWDECRGFDVGGKASNWLSAVLGQWQGENLRLLRFCLDWVRSVQLRNSVQGIEQTPSTHFADGVPYLISNHQSLQALNNALQKQGEMPVPMERFRANIEVSGLPAWDEHTGIELSEQTGKYSFALPDPCKRCQITTIDQQTATIPQADQPLNVLRSANPHITNNKPYFGQKVVLRKGADNVISVGDELRVVIPTD